MGATSRQEPPSSQRQSTPSREPSENIDAEAIDLKFHISMTPEVNDPINVPVEAKDAPPQMFREGIGVVVEGSYDGKVFHADRVIVKHSNEYQPPAEGEKPEQLYKTLMDES